MVVPCVLLFKPSPQSSYDTKRHQLRRDCLPRYLLLGSLHSTCNVHYTKLQCILA